MHWVDVKWGVEVVLGRAMEGGVGGVLKMLGLM